MSRYSLPVREQILFSRSAAKGTAKSLIFLSVSVLACRSVSRSALGERSLSRARFYFFCSVSCPGPASCARKPGAVFSAAVLFFMQNYFFCKPLCSDLISSIFCLRFPDLIFSAGLVDLLLRSAPLGSCSSLSGASSAC
jgi:hypothetical protein